MTYLLSRNSRIEEDLIDQLFNSSEKRLARLLLLLANFGKDGTPQPIAAQISQETLAEMIGTTRSRVSFFMNKFRKLGFITYNGKIEVHNSLLNAVLYDKPEIVRATTEAFESQGSRADWSSLAAHSRNITGTVPLPTMTVDRPRARCRMMNSLQPDSHTIRK